MAVTTFIPEVWSAGLITALEERHVAAQDGIVNRNYEGEIAEYGDTVHIGYLSDPTIAPYTRNSTTVAPEVLTTTDDTLVIDQAQHFAFKVDDLDAAQVRDNGELVGEAGARAAVGLRDVLDTYLFSQMVADAGTTLTAADVDSADDAFLLLRRLRMTLGKENVPTDGRWVVVSPEFETVLLGDARFISADAYGSNAPIMNGEIGRALGFRILVSNNLPGGFPGSTPEVSNYVIAGHSMATTFAEQIAKVESYRSHSAFADVVRGLHLYGAKVVRPEALVICDADVTVV